jgi:hypothetical protein
MIILVIIVVVDLPKRKWTLMSMTKTCARIVTTQASMTLLMGTIQTLLVEFVAAMQQYVMVVK